MDVFENLELDQPAHYYFLFPSFKRFLKERMQKSTISVTKYHNVLEGLKTLKKQCAKCVEL